MRLLLKKIACFWVLVVALGVVHANEQQIALEVTRSAPMFIDAENNFAETETFVVQAVYPHGHPNAGATATQVNARVRIEEWRTEIYDGLYGATQLPTSVPMSKGRAQFTLRSLARYEVLEKRSAPVPEVVVTLGDYSERMLVPQWVDIDSDGQIDWLQQQVELLVSRGMASDNPELRAVLASVEHWQQSWRRDCGGVLPQSPTTVLVGTACLNPEGVNTHRTNLNGELAATILHEARHVWNYRNPEVLRLPKVYRPSRAPRLYCQQRNAPECNAPPEIDVEAVQVHEDEAEAFAQRFKRFLE